MREVAGEGKVKKNRCLAKSAEASVWLLREFLVQTLANNLGLGIGYEL